jgi:hypothetical protein
VKKHTENWIKKRLISCKHFMIEIVISYYTNTSVLSENINFQTYLKCFVTTDFLKCS